MSDPPPLTEGELKDVEKVIIILGAVAISLLAISIIAIIITLCITRSLSKRVRESVILTKNMRIDVRKTLEVLESAIKRNPVAIFDDEGNDGSERVSPIFTRRIFTPTTPLPFDLSILRESGEFEFDRNRKHNPLSSLGSQYKRQKMGPPVPPRRAHSFYGNGDY